MSAKPINTEMKIAEEANVMKGLLYWVQESFNLRKDMGAVTLGTGYFAAVVNIGNNQGLAMSTDGVGSKVLIAQMIDKYDTVGIDCIGMNVNDLICVGAEPIAMLNYLALQKAQPRLLEDIGKGLYEGARQAGITLPGGEMAKLPEIINGVKEGYGFDLAGTSVGLLPLDKINIGQNVETGDVLIGLASSGIHSNGFTLARKILLEEQGLKIDQKINELGRTLGEELIEPTRIYVAPVMEMLKKVNVKAMAHITGGGLFNLTRTAKPVGYDLDFWPQVPAIFSLIQKKGNIPFTRMFSEYNMGVGFCVTVPSSDVAEALKIAKNHNIDAWVLGIAREDEQRSIKLKPYDIVSKNKALCFQ